MALPAYTRWPVLRQRMGYQRGRECVSRTGISLRSCYAMSGTDLAYDVISLRACYARSGTDIACGTICLRACYAMSGNDIASALAGTGLAYGATSAYAGAMRCPVLRTCMAVPDTVYFGDKPLVCQQVAAMQYAMSGTRMAYVLRYSAVCPTPYPVLAWRTGIAGTDIAYGTTRMALRGVRY
eukprot:3530058-Rhodomonas_salina.4